MNDLTRLELDEVLMIHREICQGYPRQGNGEDMYVVLDKVGTPSPAGV